MAEQLCPCGSGLPLESCCGPVIDGSAPAADAAALVRARYSAFALKNYPFLVESVHPDFRGDLTPENLAEGLEDVVWTGLEIGACEKDVDLGKEGLFDTVELKAVCEYKGEERTLEELSLFKWEDGRVYYVDGVPKRPETYHRPEPKVGRNEPCPCGSGKKYKKCCGAA